MEPFQFDMPKNQHSAIKVIGVGGGGTNAVNYMYSQGIEGVDFAICNTDAQALNNSPVPNKIQLGISVTEGLGAGANPEIGEQAALESKEDIKAMFSNNTKLAFITAGMGGGTGTGAAPVIAQIAQEMGILTVGIVTFPFQFEGKSRLQSAEEGIDKLRAVVDSLIVINNNKLRDLFGNLGYKTGFSKADEVLAKAAKGIAEVITKNYTINIDLRDAKTVLASSGTSIMGSAQAEGENRAKEVIEGALDSPLLNDNKITGAQNVLLLIVSGNEEITVDEIGIINDYIQTEAGNNANIIMGVGEDLSLGDAISVTIVATGFPLEHQNDLGPSPSKKVYHTLEQTVTKTLVDKDLDSLSSHSEVVEKPVQTNGLTKHSLYDSEDELEEEGFSFSIQTKEEIENIEVEDELDFTVRTLTPEEQSSLEQKKEEEKNEPIQEEKKVEVQPKQTTIFSLDDEDEITIENSVPTPEPIVERTKEEEDERKRIIKERRARLMKYNTKFENLNNSNIQEIENTPAYKRKGIDIDAEDESGPSKFYLDGEEDDIQFKPNNFFDDNVD